VRYLGDPVDGSGTRLYANLVAVAARFVDAYRVIVSAYCRTLAKRIHFAIESIALLSLIRSGLWPGSKPRDSAESGSASRTPMKVDATRKLPTSPRRLPPPLSASARM
jgi:hypothetical protein